MKNRKLKRKKSSSARRKTKRRTRKGLLPSWRTKTKLMLIKEMRKIVKLILYLKK
jgi:hypothetical protein